MAAEPLLEVLIRRDGLSRADAQLYIDEAKAEVAAGANPETILRLDFGLEPDYLFDLLD